VNKNILQSFILIFIIRPFSHDNFEKLLRSSDPIHNFLILFFELITILLLEGLFNQTKSVLSYVLSFA
jgi:hypothetical protein